MAASVGVVLTAPFPVWGQLRTRADSIEQVRTFFESVRQAKKSTPQSTLQTWIQLTEAFSWLNSTISDPNVTGNDASLALRVQGVGYQVVELFDFAIASELAAIDKARDDRQRGKALDDLAQSFETIGFFPEAVTARKRSMALSGSPSLPALNNLALSLLKAGEYEECIATVNLIDLSQPGVAHTRLFSARAFGYSGKYGEALTELQKACDHNARDACSMRDQASASSNPGEFWKQDRKTRMMLWVPHNSLFDSAKTLLVGARIIPMADGHGASMFIPASWFNDVYPLYRMEDGALLATYPEQLPRGKIGFIVVDGVPFFAAKVHRVSEDSLMKSVASFMHQNHSPSASSESGPAASRALVTTFPDGDYLVLIVHTDWQETLIRSRGNSMSWKTVVP
jgi:tetratricopeptide (TPR) repeat protein